MTSPLPSTEQGEPLHVRVARALGCAPYLHDDLWFCDEPKCKGGDVVRYSTGFHVDGDYGAIPAYDTDWSATGPLIEKYKLQVWFPYGASEWWADEFDTDSEASGPTPLIAVCNLLLKMGEEGKL